MFSKAVSNSRPGSWFSALALLPLLGLLVAKSCDPIVTEFKARPLHVCGNKPITITWNTKGEATTLAADHPVRFPLGRVDNHGEASVILSQTTTFSLRSRLRGEEGVKKLTVEFIPSEGGKTSIEGQALCQLGAAVYTTTLPPDDWDQAIRVNTIANTSDRPIRVMHGDSALDLDPGESSESLAGSPIGGTWTLSAKLRPFEKCEANDMNKPREPLPYLALEVGVFCHYP
jgi:hypothetical protein